MNLKRLQGAVETIDAAGKTGKTEGLEDVARDLRDALNEFAQGMHDDMEAALAPLAADESFADSKHVQGAQDKLESWRGALSQFAPRLGDDPYRPNPQTQPADPNPVATGGPVPTPGDPDSDPDAGSKSGSKK